MKKHKSFLVVLSLLVVILTGCSNEFGKVIASEKNEPSDIHDVGSRPNESPNIKSLVYRVTSETLLKDAWEYFNMKENIPKVKFDRYDYYFVSISESGTCPFKLTDTTINEYKKEINFYFTDNGDNCTADATPKTLVIEVDKTIANGLENASIIYLTGKGNLELRTTEKIRE
ncbi:hypothetical protein [Litchfieldia salsa]|uniref:Lipoprotein n=1 Tax=Litchfieldia salsa TaxID=930152 RepID=A0A1H0X4F0_9BACI|nr:hypothetical protein [Litchfieldia salsa]SDP97356.1 hypothetical protein SAMN05216565_12812 [Litchfieldia salsa]